MRTQLVDGLFADLLQVVRFLRVYENIVVLRTAAIMKFIHRQVMLDVCDSFKLNYLQNQIILQVKEHTFFCIPIMDIREKKTILRQTKAEVNDLPEILFFAVENAKHFR